MTKGEMRSRMIVVHLDVEVNVLLLNLDKSWSEVWFDVRYVLMREPGEADMIEAIVICPAAQKEGSERELRISKSRRPPFTCICSRPKYLSFSIHCHHL